MNSMWCKNKYRKDLNIFQELINRYGIEGEFDAIESIKSNLGTQRPLEYHIQNMCFFIKGRSVGSRPDNMNYCQIILGNKVYLSDTLSNDCDPIYRYQLDLTINLYPSEKKQSKSYTSSWHLDKERNGGSCKYTHPYYHFQFGGKKFELLDPDMGLLNSPRIPHPPMDIFLAFHFVLKNFYNNSQFSFVNEIVGDPDYISIIKRAQHRLWDPYFKAFDVEGNTHQDFVIDKIFPLYIS